MQDKVAAAEAAKKHAYTAKPRQAEQLCSARAQDAPATACKKPHKGTTMPVPRQLEHVCSPVALQSGHAVQRFTSGALNGCQSSTSLSARHHVVAFRYVYIDVISQHRRCEGPLSSHLCKRSSCCASARRTPSTAPLALSADQLLVVSTQWLQQISEAACLNVTHPPELDHCTYAAHGHSADPKSCSTQCHKGPCEGAQAPEQRHACFSLPSAWLCSH